MNFEGVRLLISTMLIVGLVLYGIAKMSKQKKIFTNQFIAKTAIFAAISIILYCVPLFQIKLPFFPSFLEIHLDEIPALMAGFAYGPISGAIVILLKTVVKLPLTSTAGCGELCDLIYSSAFVITASLIYKKRHSFKGALASCLIGSIVQIVVASLVTTYIMLDVYTVLYPGLTKEVILIMCNKVNPLIDNLTYKFILFVSLPFNALKDAAVVVLTLLLYKRLHTFIDRVSIKKTRA